MRISVDVTGHLDWEPCPPGTKITEGDKAAGRVKLLSDSRWHMRIERTGETHHDMGIHEIAVCRRMVALLAVGKPKDREEVIAELVRFSLEHHVKPRHIVKVHVHDDGPDEETFKAALAEHATGRLAATPEEIAAHATKHSVTIEEAADAHRIAPDISDEHAAGALSLYMTPQDIEHYLNAIFARAPKAPEAK